MQDSLRYCFADDTDSWIFDKPMNLEISKSGERLNLSGPFNREQFGNIFYLGILVVVDC